MHLCLSFSHIGSVILILPDYAPIVSSRNVVFIDLTDRIRLSVRSLTKDDM